MYEDERTDSQPEPARAWEDAGAKILYIPLTSAECDTLREIGAGWDVEVKVAS